MPRSVVGTDYTQRVGKFGEIDTKYLVERQAVSAALGPQELWTVIDQWPLYSGIMTLARNLQFVEMVRSTLSVPGDVVEFGCWKGSTLLLFAKVLAIYDPHGIKVVHGFSKFDVGFTPEEWGGEDNAEVAELYRNSCKGELGTLQAMIRLGGLSGSVELHDGDVGETWPAWKSAHPNRLISLAYFDMDLYRPTALALDGLHERLVSGAIIGFDQSFHVDWPGEGKAALEYMSRYEGCYTAKHVQGARQPELVLVRR